MFFNITNRLVKLDLKRKNVANEILTTEIDYIKNLQILSMVLFSIKNISKLLLIFRNQLKGIFKTVNIEKES